MSLNVISCPISRLTGKFQLLESSFLPVFRRLVLLVDDLDDGVSGLTVFLDPGTKIHPLPTEM